MSRRSEEKEIRPIVARVRTIPPGTRMRCKDDGAIYQMGAQQGMSSFWMMRENPPHRGLVDARTIDEHFEVLQEVK